MKELIRRRVSSGAVAHSNPACVSRLATRTPASRSMDAPAGCAAGKPLDASVRAYFEPRFAFDFSRVRIHADDVAAASAASVNALAFTVGNHIAFAAGQLDPGGTEGRVLLAHELAHVVQQGGGATAADAGDYLFRSGGSPSLAAGLQTSQASDPHEREAADIAASVVSGAPVLPVRTTPLAPIVARQQPSAATDDVLAALPPTKVAAWYSRLADSTEKKGAEVSALLMRKWLSNRDPKATITIPAHPHVVSSTSVSDGLMQHRRIYLTEEKAHVNGGERWAGIVPRLQTGTWSGSDTLDMHYQGLATSGSAYIAAMKYKMGTMSQSDADLFTSLHDFQLGTDVTVKGKSLPDGKVGIEFTNFVARALDRYDWDVNKHLTVPNPDAASKKPDAVAPDQNTITVYHTNARRVEAAGLAAPYDLATEAWDVKDAKVVGPGTVDPKKKL